MWQAVNAVKPRVVVIEYNGKFPPDLEWKQAYNSNHVWDGSDWQGASLKAYELLGRELGYQLAGTNLNGVNAFFVRQDLAEDKFITPAAAKNTLQARHAKGTVKLKSANKNSPHFSGGRTSTSFTSYSSNGFISRTTSRIVPSRASRIATTLSFH